MGLLSVSIIQPGDAQPPALISIPTTINNIIILFFIFYLTFQNHIPSAIKQLTTNNSVAAPAANPAIYHIVKLLFKR